MNVESVLDMVAFGFIMAMVAAVAHPNEDLGGS